MIVSVNGYVLNDPTNPNSAYLDEPIDGLGLPPVRTSSGNYSGRDGGYVGSQFYGMRLITLTGRFFSTSPVTLEASRQALAAAVASSSITLTLTTNAGASYLITCNVDSLDMPINRSVSTAPFKLSLIAPDPIIYDNSAAAMSVAITRSVGGGITWPISWTPVTWAPGSQPIAINNTGGVIIYPVITLNNAMTNPTITNVTTGQSFSLNGFTTAAGDVVVIDMKNRTVLLNGGSVLPYVTTSSIWWSLIPGSNSVSLNSTNGADTVTGTVSWRAGYRGI